MILSDLSDGTKDVNRKLGRIILLNFYLYYFIKFLFILFY